jgi:hypothetical protein
VSFFSPNRFDAELVSRERPVLMILEDAHWADPTSLELLDEATELVRRLPILMVIKRRPDPASFGRSTGHVGDRGGGIQIDLTPRFPARSQGCPRHPLAFLRSTGRYLRAEISQAGLDPRKRACRSAPDRDPGEIGYTTLILPRKSAQGRGPDRVLNQVVAVR